MKKNCKKCINNWRREYWLQFKMLEENFEDVRIKIIEKQARAEEIANELTSSIVINGDALDEEILKEANLEGSETVLALTNDDENNMMACVLAENRIKRTIAIVNKTEYNLTDSLNIDDLVDTNDNSFTNYGTCIKAQLAQLSTRW